MERGEVVAWRGEPRGTPAASPREPHTLNSSHTHTHTVQETHNKYINTTSYRFSRSRRQAGAPVGSSGVKPVTTRVIRSAAVNESVSRVDVRVRLRASRNHNPRSFDPRPDHSPRASYLCLTNQRLKMTLPPPNTTRVPPPPRREPDPTQTGIR